MDAAFHTAFRLPDGAQPADSGDGPARALRPLDWAELCARLVALNDFRASRSAGSVAEQAPASFHGTAAQWLAKLGGRHPETEDEAAVNRTPSGAGKAPWGKTLPDAGSMNCAVDASVEFEKPA